jgi:hypothetical protein
VKRRLGVCFRDGTIRIRLFHARTGRPLKYSSLVDTLCHELAHLRHFNHGKRFQAFYRRILEHARRERIYRPGTAASVRGPQRTAMRPAFPPAPPRLPRAFPTTLQRGVAARAGSAPERSVVPRTAPEQLALF